MNSQKHSDSIRAVIWIHSNHETGDPISFEAFEWYGDVYLLEKFVKTHPRDLDSLALPTDTPLDVTLKFERAPISSGGSHLVEIALEKTPFDPKRPEYAYKDINEIESILGFKVNEAFKDGWRMARTMMETLR